MSGAIIIEGHIQGLSNTRALGEAGVPVYVVDTTSCIAQYSKHCRKFFRSPGFNSDEFAEFLIDLARSEDIRGWLLLPSNDHAVHTIARHRKALEESYGLVTPPLEVIDNIYDKVRLISLATKLRVPVPLTWLPGAEGFEDKGSLPYPLIVKGRNGLSFYKRTGRKAFLIQSVADYDQVMGRLDMEVGVSNCFLQEVIPYDSANKTISFTVFSINGKIMAWWTGSKIREHPLRFGTATFCESVVADSLREPSERILRELEYTGICELEYLRDHRDGQHKLIEINARTWLWTGLARAAGVDFALMAYDFVNGRDVTFPGSYRAGVRWANRYTDFFYSLSAMLKGRLNIREFLASYRGEVVDAVWYKGDNRPALMYFLYLFRFFRHR
ncbi:MAG: hypothetical protein RBS37_07495 [Bacteroidales bacterium]|jgi:predicted ATP-grasp superfamily ATP-dependent carboligase|nr:hypothetical protein [Bacteroidales bacterium]